VLWRITYVFTQGSVSSKANSQSTPGTFPTASLNRGYNARGKIILPPFIAGNIYNIRTRLTLGLGLASRSDHELTPNGFDPRGDLGTETRWRTVTGRSVGIPGILSGRVTAPVPLKYDICDGSGQAAGFRLSITPLQDFRLNGAYSRQRTSALFSGYSYATTCRCIQAHISV